MDSHSEHSADPDLEDSDVASLASTPSEIEASAGPRSPAETAEPAPQPGAVEASGAGVAAASLEGPAAAEAASEAEAGPEELARPEPEGAPREPEQQAAQQGRTEEAPSPGCLPPPTTDQGRAARAPGAEREAREESELQQKRPGAAPREGSEWTQEAQTVQEQQLRAELLDQYRALLRERRCYQRCNVYLQHKISEALRRKKGLDAAEAADSGAGPRAPDKEQAYVSHLALLEELRKQQADDLDWYRQERGQLRQQCEEKLSRVEKAWRDFQALKKQVVMQAMGSCRMRGGRQAALREVEQIQALEDKKEKEMSAVRLENVRLKQGLVHFETRMRAQEDMAEGLLLIDFEQLKIENQTFNEKVEERNEELLKLRNKVNSNVQIITHVKEKLHFVEIGNAGKKSQLSEVEAQVALRRDILTKTKQARDSLRLDNIKLNQKSGLLGKGSLLRDMEEKVGRAEGLRQRLESLKRQHAGLTLSCRGAKQQILEARAFLPC